MRRALLVGCLICVLLVGVSLPTPSNPNGVFISTVLADVVCSSITQSSIPSSSVTVSSIIRAIACTPDQGGAAPVVVVALSWIGWELDEYSGDRYEFSNPGRTAGSFTKASNNNYQVSPAIGLTAGPGDFFACADFQMTVAPEAAAEPFFALGGTGATTRVLLLSQSAGSVDDYNVRVWREGSTINTNISVVDGLDSPLNTWYFGCGGFDSGVVVARIRPLGGAQEAASTAFTGTVVSSSQRLLRIGNDSIGENSDTNVQLPFWVAGLDLTAATFDALKDLTRTCAAFDTAVTGLGGTMEECWDLPGGDTVQVAFKNSANDLIALNAPGRIVGFSFLQLEEIGGVVPRAVHPNTELAASFDDALDEFLNLADNATISAGDIPFYFGGWFIIDDSTTIHTLISKATAETTAGVEYRIVTNITTPTVACQVSDGTTIATVTSVAAVTVGTEFDILCIHDSVGNTIGNRLDGAAIVTVANPTSGIQDSTGDLRIGRLFTATDDLDGAASNVFIGKDLPTTAEGDALHNGGVTLPIRRFATVAPDLTLTEGWPLDESSGSRLAFIASANDLGDNATVLSRAGNAPRAYLAADFPTGTADRLRETDPADLECPDDCAVAIWLKQRTTGTQVAASKFNATTDAREWLLRANAATNYQFEVSSDGTGATLTTVSAGTPAVGVWRLIYAYHDGTAAEIGISVDGGAFVTAAHAGGVFEGTADFLLGVQGDTTPSSGYDGAEAVFIKWDTRHTISQVRQLLPGFRCDRLPANFQTSLTACANLSESSGNRAWSTEGTHTGTLVEEGTVGSAQGIIDLESHTLPAAELVAASTQSLQLADTGAGDLFDVNGRDFAFLGAFKLLSGAGNPAIFSKDQLGAAAARGYIFFDSTGTGRATLQMSDGVSTTCQASGPDTLITLGQWHTYWVYFDATAEDCAVKIDDRPLVIDTTAGGGPDDQTVPFEIGSVNTGSSSHWNGPISVTAFFKDTILSEAAALAFRNSGAGLRCSDVAAVVGVAPSECFPLTERSGVRAAFITTPGNDLAAVNNPLSKPGVLVTEPGYGAQGNATAHLEVPDAPRISVESGESYEIVGWTFTPAGIVADEDIFGKTTGTLAADIEYAFEWLSSTPQFRFTSSDGTTIDTVDSTASGAPVDSWYFYSVGCASATEISIDINDSGTRQTTSVTACAQDDTAPLSMFFVGAGTSEGSGTLPTFLMIKRALTPAERTCLFNADRGKALADVQADCSIN